MEQKEIKIGLCGFGAMGKTHAFAVKNLPFYFHNLPFSAKILGVATRSMEKSLAVTKEFGFEIAADNEDDLINNPEIDVIDICTPNICHAKTALKALAAGKHIYCEKPLCDNLEDAEILAKKAALSGLICTAVFNNRHLSAVEHAKELIDAGKIGRILHFSFSYLHNSCTDVSKPAGWKQNADICGRGGVLFDLGAHVIDLTVFLCGKFSKVYGKSQIGFSNRIGSNGLPWQTNAPESFYMTVETESGSVGSITASKLTTGANDDLSFEIYGEKGSLRFSLMNPNYLEFYDTESPAAPRGGLRGFTAIECVGRYEEPAGSFPSPKAPIGWLRGHVTSMYRFLNAVYTGVQNKPDFADAAYVQLVMERALQSADKATELKMEEEV